MHILECERVDIPIRDLWLILGNKSMVSALYGSSIAIPRVTRVVVVVFPAYRTIELSVISHGNEYVGAGSRLRSSFGQFRVSYLDKVQILPGLARLGPRRMAYLNIIGRNMLSE